MKKVFLPFFIAISFLIIYSPYIYSQLSIDAPGTNYTIDFESTLAGVNEDQFTGAGFQPVPASGQLDSDAWSVTGLSDGVLNFGDTGESGDFARGSSTGGVTPGGIYGFTVATGNNGLGIQPSSADFTSGNLYLRTFNNTGESIITFSINYNIYVYNDAPRANSLNFSYSSDHIQYYAVPSLGFISTEAPDPTPVWISYPKTETITGINIENGDYLYFKWRGEDETGSGNRDEFAVDDIVLNVTSTDQTIVLLNSTFLEVNEEDGSFNITVGIQNPFTNPTQVDIVLIDAATYSADLNGFTFQTITFPPNDGNDQTVVINITDDEFIEGVENLVFELQNVSGGNSAFIGNPFQFNLSIRDNDVFDIVINEIHADPDLEEGDANGDGSINTGEDEFVEIINNESFSVDISGWTLNDGFGVRHTFPSTTIVPAGHSIVVFGGGTPTGIPGLVQTTSAGFLGLNNDGDNVIIRDLLSNISDNYSYGTEGGENEALARNPDFSGSFVKHMSIANNSVRYSPGKKNTDGSPLPVELSLFTAKVMSSGGVRLDWRTETEIDNYGFEIERTQRSNVKGQMPEFWEEIGFVEGQGNSNSPKEYTFKDNNTQYGKYAYRLKQIDTDGDYEYSNVLEVDAGKIPDGFVLEQNYPNPFNPNTTIKFAIAETKRAELRVFDMLGNEVAILYNGIAEGGKVYETEFEASLLSSGIYFYRLATDRKVENRKMLLLK